MKSILSYVIFLMVALTLVGLAQSKEGKEMPKEDIIKTSDGDLKITFIGHGTLMLTFNNKTIHIDPVSREADYSKLPSADLIMITHEHGDHLDPKAIKAVSKPETEIVLTRICAEQVEGGIVMKNGDIRTIGGLKIEAIPAYNIVHERQKGQPFHPKGNGNGYVITFGHKSLYSRRYGEYARDEEIERYRRGFSPHESALYYDTRDGS